MNTYEYRIVGRRLAGVPETKGDSPEEAAVYITSRCLKEEDAWRETAFALFLDRKNRILGHMLVSVGGPNSTVMDPAVVAKGAVGTLANGVIITHNHPSGDPAPSKEDIERTRRLKLALSLFDIKLLDHIIIGDGKAYSFNDERTFNIET